MKDSFVLGNRKFSSRFILGSGKFSLEMMAKVIEASGAEMATIAIRRANPGGEGNIIDYIPEDILLLPNTSGARTADEAVRIAHLARELGCGEFIKIEVIRDSKYLLPDNHETIKACKTLADEGFIPMAYMMPDLNVAKDLQAVGAAAVMPLGAPIGSNKGLLTKDFVKILVDEIDVPVIVDAGIGSPSQACEAMEIGVEAVMANTAIATANNVVEMAKAFRLAIEAGRLGYLAGLGRVLDKAEASSPLTGFLDE
jgi:thiazole synthase